MVFSFSLWGGEHQEFLQKKGMLYDGWQDEGLLELQKEGVPSFPRMSTAELHRRVKDAIALAEDCQNAERSVASEGLPEKCMKSLEDW